MDNLNRLAEPDRSKINMHEAYEVKYWTHQLGVTRGAIAKGGRQGRQQRRRGAQATGGLTGTCVFDRDQSRCVPDYQPRANKPCTGAVGSLMCSCPQQL